MPQFPIQVSCVVDTTMHIKHTVRYFILFYYVEWKMFNHDEMKPHFLVKILKNTQKWIIYVSRSNKFQFLCKETKNFGIFGVDAQFI